MGRVKSALFDPDEDDGWAALPDEPSPPPTVAEMTERAARVMDIDAAWNGRSGDERYLVTVGSGTTATTFLFPDAKAALLAFGDMVAHLSAYGFTASNETNGVRFESDGGGWYEVGFPVRA